jgi:lipoprotein-releasing system permease protein
VGAGWAIALAAAYLQNTYKLISLPPDIYFISFLPIDTHLVDFAITGGATLLICYLAALYPASKAGRLSVIEVLRE